MNLFPLKVILKLPPLEGTQGGGQGDRYLKPINNRNCITIHIFFFS